MKKIEIKQHIGDMQFSIPNVSPHLKLLRSAKEKLHMFKIFFNIVFFENNDDRKKRVKGRLPYVFSVYNVNMTGFYVACN